MNAFEYSLSWWLASAVLPIVTIVVSGAMSMIAANYNAQLGAQNFLADVWKELVLAGLVNLVGLELLGRAVGERHREWWIVAIAASVFSAIGCWLAWVSRRTWKPNKLPFELSRDRQDIVVWVALSAAGAAVFAASVALAWAEHK